ncbi:MAG: SAM-dependent methyltransferase [Bacteroidetes bacterium]|nr:MAG: SAM-dependent methyltransferase [Bacteroidota bacterium]
MSAISNNAGGCLYLIPNFIGTLPWEYQFPEHNKRIIRSLRYFIAEDLKACRNLLKQAEYPDISQAKIEEYNEHFFDKDISYLLQPLNDGHSVGLISESGVPVLADPGDDIVKLAHQKNIPVVPLIGASAVLLSVMSAGLNGNNFAFNGYLPVEKSEKIRKMKELEQLSFHKKQAQFFIETPYRNQKLFSILLQILQSTTLLSLACNLLNDNPFILTKTVADWKKLPIPDIHKKPCIFGILKM